MKRTVCDRCGRIIEDEDNDKFVIHTFFKDKLCSSVDLCSKCESKFLEWIYKGEKNGLE